MPRYIEKADAQIGKLIRTQRLAKGMSQTDLATKLDISFQQIQKYENGVNRITAARLVRIAQLLGVDVSYFFGTRDSSNKANDNAVADLLNTASAMRLMRAFNKIKSARMKMTVVDLVEGIVVSEKSSAG